MDLTNSLPRSPKIKLNGIVLLPRMLDKARAYNAKKLGEYIFPCLLDKIILEFLNIDRNEVALLAKNLTDEEIAVWVNERCLNHSNEDKKQVNQKILELKPTSQKSLNRFNDILKEINSARKDITTWVDLLELDENQKPKEKHNGNSSQK